MVEVAEKGRVVVVVAVAAEAAEAARLLEVVAMGLAVAGNLEGF